MKFKRYFIIGGLALTLGMTSCVGDLDVTPDDPNTKLSLSTREEYLGVLARAYGGLVLEGGISVEDGGAGVYTRQLYNQEELTTDNAIIGLNWNDGGVHEIGYSIPGKDNHWGYEMYSRINYQIALCNEFLRAIENGKEFFTDAEISAMKAEIHVLRGLSYYHMIDIFGKGPWTTEESLVGAIPPTYSRSELFDAVVKDLKEYAPQVTPAASQEYGRLSREAAYMLLAKLYLNAEVYTGTPMWQECADACKQVVSTGITLAPEYKYLFCATNSKYVGNGEIIWGVPQGPNTTCWGGTTYLAISGYNSTVDITKYGYFGNATAWDGQRVTPELSRALASNDKRRLIYEGTFQEDLADLSSWPADGCGYMCIKFVNTDESDYYNEHTTVHCEAANQTDIDFPLFRLADTYLMLAECQLHGVACDGLNYYNLVRTRAGLAPVGSFTADDLLKERQCELYWEGHRRSDLIRFGKYTGSSYNWQWKGGVYEGTALASYRDLMPIPAQFEATLGQNPGY